MTWKYQSARQAAIDETMAYLHSLSTEDAHDFIYSEAEDGLAETLNRSFVKHKAAEDEQKSLEFPDEWYKVNGYWGANLLEIFKRIMNAKNE